MSVRKINSDIIYLRNLRTSSFGGKRKEPAPEPEETICSICHEALLEEIITIKCNHQFHKDCLCRWFNSNHRTCPLCRVEFGLVEISELCGKDTAPPKIRRKINFDEYENQETRRLSGRPPPVTLTWDD